MVTIDIDKNICERITALREKQNLTQEELASNVGIRLKQLNKIEAGSRLPRIKELAQLAAGLDVSIGELVNQKEGYRLIDE